MKGNSGIVSRALMMSAALCTAAMSAGAQGPGSIYYNNFETVGSQNAGLTASGTLTALSRSSLPTDGGGIGSPNQSTWLGLLGSGLAKSSTLGETVTLNLSGLTVGAVYRVSFDLFIGSSWDGSAGFYGPDEWSLKATSGLSTTTLVDATFSNCGLSNELCGATSPQSYSDATPLGGVAGSTFAPETGADFFNDASLSYSSDYGIYYFGHGTGNPMLNFVAAATTASLDFTRAPVASGDSGDEYWALDNIDVTTNAPLVSSTPEPSSIVLVATGLVGLAVRVRRRSNQA